VVRFAINGEKRELRYTQRALRLLAEELKLESIAQIPRLIASLDVRIIATCVWAARLHQEPELTVDDVEGWSYPLNGAIASCSSALNIALFGHPDGVAPDEETEADEAETDPTRETSSSGGSPASSGSDTAPH
jgi:hypothetical protein